MGEHTFTYALFPHEGAVTEGGTIEEAVRLNLPAQVVNGRITEQRRLVKISGSQTFSAGQKDEMDSSRAGKNSSVMGKTALCAARSVQIDAIKKAEDEDCLIVRMHECGADGQM